VGRLINPGLGELADRYTILRLKIAHAPRLENMHFHTEQANVLTRMERHPVYRAVPLRELLTALQGTNNKLWELEDEMARYAQTEVHPDNLTAVAHLGIKIWHANRDRNTLIREINALAGTDVGPEKF